MAVDPLASAWTKYYWASKHMERVDAAIRGGLDLNVHPVSFEINLKPKSAPTSAVIRVAGLPTIRQDTGLALGDTIQNFRAALDHLAWGLVSVGDKPRPSYPEGVYFPTADSASKFRNKINQWLPGVPGDYRTIIRRYQPYRSGHRAKAIRWLVRLSNTDKHRILIPTVMSHGGVNLRVTANWPTTSFEQLIKGSRALHVGTPLLRVGLLPVVGTDCEVHVNGNLSGFPSLGRGVHIPDALGLIRETVFEILATFDGLL